MTQRRRTILTFVLIVAAVAIVSLALNLSIDTTYRILFVALLVEIRTELADLPHRRTK